MQRRRKLSVAIRTLVRMELEAQETGQALAVIERVLDGIDHLQRTRAPDLELLDVLAAAVRVSGRLTVLTQRVAAEVEASRAAEHAYGTSTVTWLADATRLTRREAAALVRAGEDLARFPAIQRASAEGHVLAQQAQAIMRVLRDLPEELPQPAFENAQSLMIEQASQFNAVELGRLSRHLLEVVSPELADEAEGKRLEREHRVAQRNRHLNFSRDGQGSVLIRGSLPIVSAEPLIRIIDAYAAQQRRALEVLDPLAEVPSPGMRRADGLLSLVQRHSLEALAPSHGGDRPRIVVTVSYDKLLKRCVDAGLVSSGEAIGAAALRQLACDADLLPVVLSGSSEPLDVGRTQRLVTPAIRAALEVRDGGCVFPGCDRSPSDCHAHHLKPWWQGGVTALSNLVLVCPHHHNIVEPGHDPTAQRWSMRLDVNGVPETIPPPYADPTQRPRHHARHSRHPASQVSGEDADVPR